MISPLDGRYYEKIKDLEEFFSDYSFYKVRYEIEIKWSQFLINLFKYDKEEIEDFSEESYKEILEIESTAMHDIKAIEIFLKKKTKYPGLVHFGLTSEDINNLAYSILLKRFSEKYSKDLECLVDKLKYLSVAHCDTLMPGRTHGQVASMTSFGKEMYVYYTRLNPQTDRFGLLRHFCGKVNGSVGNFSALYAADIDIDWIKVTDEFISSLDLVPDNITTQVANRDDLVEFFHNIIHINLILKKLCLDMWQYNSYGYIEIKKECGQTGSSAMPHKSNPINFENAEGNLNIANSLLRTIIDGIITVRMQRDLSDSTTMRNIGVALSHTILAMENISEGLFKTGVIDEVIWEDVRVNWGKLVNDTVYTILRHEYPHVDFYKELQKTPSGQINWAVFITKLEMKEEIRDTIFGIKKAFYNDIFKEIMKDIL